MPQGSPHHKLKKSGGKKEEERLVVGFVAND